jgi:hypothetical protein
MTQSSGVHRVTEALADATGRTDDEVRLAMTVAVVGAGVHVTFRVLDFLGNLGVGALKNASSR